MPDRKLYIGNFVTVQSPTHPWLDDLQGYVTDTNSASEDGPIEVHFPKHLCDPHLRSNGDFSMNFLRTEVVLADQPTGRSFRNFCEMKKLSHKRPQSRTILTQFLKDAAMRVLALPCK